MNTFNPFTVILFIFFTATQTQARIDSNMSHSEVKKVCATWAKESKQNGVSTFIIAFEGLWSLSQRKVDKLQEYHSKIKSGENVSMNLSGFGGYVTKGPLAHLVKNYGEHFEFTVLSHRTETTTNYSNALTCANEWYQVFGDQLDLNIIGHSFGGYASIFLMHKLQSFKIPVRNIMTADARAYSSGYKYFYKTDNVESFDNYFQKGFLPGYEIEGASNTYVKGQSHGSIPSSPQFIDAVSKIFEGF